MHHDVALNALRSINLTEALETSFLDYHAKGMHYLCLKRTPELTLKLYLIEPDHQPADRKRGWLVMPHNHAYAFEQVVLAGSINQILFKVDENAKKKDFFRLWWNPQARMGSAFVPTMVGLRSRSEWIGVRRGYAMRTDQVHTIAARRDEPTLLLSYQHHDEEAVRTAVYSSLPELRCKGYRKPSGIELAHLITRCEALIKRNR